MSDQTPTQAFKTPKRRFSIGKLTFRTDKPWRYWECSDGMRGSTGRTPWTAWWRWRKWSRVESMNGK